MMHLLPHSPFQVDRLGIVMQAEPGRADECEEVLNPAAARGPDGHLYLFPRLVGRGNYSRVGVARVRFDATGTPRTVERLGYALEPTEPCERRPEEGTGGCEDPRVTCVAALRLYVMTYTAWGPAGPRLALAISEDLWSWQRLGRVAFAPAPQPEGDLALDRYDNKDGILFPAAVYAPDGRLALAMLHRPVYPDCPPSGVHDGRPSIWLSYCALDDVRRDVQALACLWGHHVLLHPRNPWEEWRIGGGTPPLRTPRGWLLLYHGVQRVVVCDPVGLGTQIRAQYAAGALLLDGHDPRRVLYRSPTPLLTPQTRGARWGCAIRGVPDQGGRAGRRPRGRLLWHGGPAHRRGAPAPAPRAPHPGHNSVTRKGRAGPGRLNIRPSTAAVGTATRRALLRWPALHGWRCTTRPD